MTNPACPVCASPTKAMPPHPQARLYRCPRCTHAFSQADSILDPEGYGASYFEHEHKRWFQFPNIYLFKRIARLLPQGASVLDVGCGRGDLLLFLSKARPDLRLAGIDLRANEAADGIRFLQGDILQTDIGERFDAILTLAVIEHVAGVAGFVRRLGELAGPGATIVITTLDENGLLYQLARAGKRVGIPLAFNRLYSKHHLHHFTAGSLRALLLRNGLWVAEHWHHNAPLKAMDIPVENKVGEAALRCALCAVWAAGRATGRTYLQTAICTNTGSEPLARRWPEAAK